MGGLIRPVEQGMQQLARMGSFIRLSQEDLPDLTEIGEAVGHQHQQAEQLQRQQEHQQKQQQPQETPLSLLIEKQVQQQNKHQLILDSSSRNAAPMTGVPAINAAASAAAAAPLSYAIDMTGSRRTSCSHTPAAGLGGAGCEHVIEHYKGRVRFRALSGGVEEACRTCAAQEERLLVLVHHLRDKELLLAEARQLVSP